ncbi:hypothetical protein, partial [Mitsuokella jalaludinii]|uniref:hypothetical protein n=1 Tax=Mitsuokella jalaludinii TaxID=187979 RepID=UPI003C6D5F7C
VAQNFVSIWLTFSLTFTLQVLPQFLERALLAGLGQLQDQIVHGEEFRLQAHLAGFHANGNGQMRLACADWAVEDEVLVLPDELAALQLFVSSRLNSGGTPPMYSKMFRRPWQTHSAVSLPNTCVKPSLLYGNETVRYFMRRQSPFTLKSASPKST